METRDSLLTVLVRKHLSKKLKRIFAMLNQIEGVSDSDALLKQQGDKEEHQSKQRTDEHHEKKPKSNA